MVRLLRLVALSFTIFIDENVFLLFFITFIDLANFKVKTDLRHGKVAGGRISLGTSSHGRAKQASNGSGISDLASLTPSNLSLLLF